MINSRYNINVLLKRIVWINLFFFTLLMVLSIGVFLVYDSNFLSVFPKIDIFKVFFQAARFHLSTFAYLNLPVLIIILLFPAVDSPAIPKSTTALIKIYYILGFLTLFFLNIGALITFQSIPHINSDFIAQLIALLAYFDTRILIILIFSLSFILLSILVILFLTVSFAIKTSEYEIFDRKKNIITICILIIICLFFARGNIIKHISHSDHQVTPSIQLNKYAQNGIYKTLHDIKNFDPANLKINPFNESFAAIHSENEKIIDEAFKKAYESTKISKTR